MQLLETEAGLYMKMCGELFIWQAKLRQMNIIIFFFLKKSWTDNDLIMIMQHQY